MAQGRDDIRVRLSAEGQTEIIRGLRDISKEAGAANRATLGAVSQLRALLPTLGFGAAIAGLTAITRGAAEFDDAMAKASLRVGSSVENFSALAFAGRTADASMQDIETSLGRLARNVSEFKQGTGEAAEGLRALGLSANDFAQRDTVESFELIARRIAALPPGMDRTRLAMELLGRGGAKLIPLMQDVATKGLAQVRAEAESFGALVRGETAQAAQELNDDFTRLESAAQGLGRNLARPLLKPLSEITKAMAEAAKEGSLLKALWVGLGGTFALFTGQTDAQKARAELEQRARDIEIFTKRIADIQADLERGSTKPTVVGGIELRGAERFSDSRMAKLRADLVEYQALLEQARTKVAELQKQEEKSAGGTGVEDSIFDSRQKLAELEKRINADQLKTLEDIASRRQQIAQEELASAERLATARATTEAQQTGITLDAIRQRQQLLKQGFDAEIRAAQVKEQALAEAAAQSTPRGRSLQELQAQIAKQSFDSQLKSAQTYYAALSKLNADYLSQYTASQNRIKALDEELAQSRQQNERDIADARRAGLSEAQRQAEDFRRLEQVRADFGNAVVRNAGAEARALKSTFDELARGLRGVEGFESAVGRIDAEVQSLFGSLIGAEKAREQALGKQAADGVRATNAELKKAKDLTTDLSRQQLEPLKPTVDQQGLRDLRDLVAKALLASPFRINVAPQILGSGSPAFASGGMVGGTAPHPRADNVLARVTPGEFIHSVAAVRHYGPNFMADVNARRFPRFADGGLVGDLGSASSDPQRDVVDVNINVGGKTIRLQSEREQAHALVRALGSVSGGR